MYTIREVLTEIHFWQITESIFVSSLGQPYKNWKIKKTSHALESSEKPSINVITQQHIKL